MIFTGGRKLLYLGKIGKIVLSTVQSAICALFVISALEDVDVLRVISVTELLVNLMPWYQLFTVSRVYQLKQGTI